METLAWKIIDRFKYSTVFGNENIHYSNVIQVKVNFLYTLYDFQKYRKLRKTAGKQLHMHYPSA